MAMGESNTIASTRPGSANAYHNAAVAEKRGAAMSVQLFYACAGGSGVSQQSRRTIPSLVLGRNSPDGNMPEP